MGFCYFNTVAIAAKQLQLKVNWKNIIRHNGILQTCSISGSKYASHIGGGLGHSSR